MRRSSLLLMTMLLFVMIPLSGVAQDFTSSVNKNPVAMGDQFEISFMLAGASGGNNFRPPSFDNFLVLSGPNQSSNFQMGTGGTFASITYSFILQPRSEGKFTIGSASIDYNGKQLQTKPLTIEVVKGMPQSKRQQQGTDQADIAKQIGDNLFIKVTTDKTKAYQGEQITATYKIYSRVRLVNLGVSKTPSLTGFWTEDLATPQQIQWKNEAVNGKQYQVGVLKKVALFPQRSGTLDVDPMEIEVVLQVQSRRRSNDFFDQFFNDPFFGNVQNVNHKLRSEPLKLAVMPLPSENAPDGFTGAVGKFSMNAWLDKPQTKTGEAVTLKVKIEGRGNLKLLAAPKISFPPDLEQYDPKISDNVSNQGDKISGSRTFEFVLIPRHPGTQKIAAFPFTFFDTDKERYVVVKSADFILSVEKGSDVVQSTASGISKEDVKLLGEDIRFIKSGDVSLHRPGGRFVGSTAFYILSASPLIAFIGFIVAVRRREKILGDVLSIRNRKARKMAQRRLAQAHKFLHAKKKEEFYAEVSRALWGYVGDKLGLPPAELSIDAVRTSLISKNVLADIVGTLTETIEQCEYARFAPGSDTVQMDAFYNRAVSLISTIEDHIR